MINKAIILSLAFVLAGCTGKNMLGWPDTHWKNQDFKPYVDKQEYAQPASTKGEAWLYQAGIEPSAVAQQLASSNIINKVKRQRRYETKGKNLIIFVGSNFYKLSDADKKQVIKLTDAMYRLSEQPDWAVYLKDTATQKTIGQYADKTLMLY